MVPLTTYAFIASRSRHCSGTRLRRSRLNDWSDSQSLCRPRMNSSRKSTKLMQTVVPLSNRCIISTISTRTDQALSSTQPAYLHSLQESQGIFGHPILIFVSLAQQISDPVLLLEQLCGNHSLIKWSQLVVLQLFVVTWKHTLLIWLNPP